MAVSQVGQRATPVRRVGRTEVVIGVAVLVALVCAGLWFGWRQIRGTAASLEVDGAPITNPSSVLSDAEDELRRLAAADGAVLPAGAGCWFAPPAPNAVSRGPRVACGPVLLGIAGDGEHWLVGSPQFVVTDDLNGSPGATGTFTRFDGVASLNDSLLRRPDGVQPPDEQPEPGTDGVRTEDGRIVGGLEAALAQADSAFGVAARASAASVDASARCFLAVREATRAGATVLVGQDQVWCGPVLLATSGPGEIWARYGLSYGRSDSIVEATVQLGTLTDVRQTATPTADVVLYRPDGIQPPTSAGSLTPPDPDPVAPGTVRLLEALPTELDVTVPGDGRLVTPVTSLKITGLARVPRIGVGESAVVAPPGEELVVVTFAATRPDDAPSGSGTATVVAGSVRLPVPGWDEVTDGAALVASVPQDAGEVTLDVLFGGRTQRISLLTGERAPGAPAALYRERTTVGVGAPLSATVALPAGEPVRVTGSVARADLQAWRPTEGWADAGRAYLALTVEDWAVDRPCCDVTDLEVTTAWDLVLSGGAAVRALGNTTDAGTPELVFDVPEDVVGAQLRLTVTASFTSAGAAGRAAGSGAVDLVLPR